MLAEVTAVGLSDVMRLFAQELFDVDDALCCALVCTKCRDAVHETYPLRHVGVTLPRGFRFSASILGCVQSVGRLQFARSIRAMPWGSMDCLVAAARIGRKEVCEMLVAEVSPPPPTGTDRAPAEVCRAAAFGGHVDVLELVHSKGFAWDASCCAAAAHAGDLPTLQWLRQQGCPWDKATTSRAAVEGHTAVLDWAREHGCEYSEETIMRMRMAKLHLAMRPDAGHAAGESHETLPARVLHGSEGDHPGVLMVSRHAPCWPSL